MKRICLYGPESTGKSFLAAKLASAYKTEFVPEVAKEFITSNDFSIEDIIRIGREQVARTVLKEKTANKILICDTDLITTQIYSRVYLGDVPDILFDLEQEVSYDQYFLFDIDVPWVPDGMRDLSHKRQEMYNIFKNELVKRRLPFIQVAGDYEHREMIVRNEIERLIGLAV